MTKKKKEKTAKNKGQWIGNVFYMLLGAACGIFDLMYMDTAGQSEKGLFSDIISLALMLIGTYAAMLIQLIIHEAGHLIFGLMTGYRFSSFRIANLMWVKLDGRIQCRKLHIAGTCGQCLMIPPDLKDGKMPVAAVLAGTDDSRDENAVLPDALRRFLHGLVVPHLERVIWEVVQLRQREQRDFILLCSRSGLCPALRFAFRFFHIRVPPH